MGRSLNAPLSPNEEIALRRVALGLGPRGVLTNKVAARLRSLLLIEDSEQGVRLTPVGQQRYLALPGMSLVGSSPAHKKPA